MGIGLVNCTKKAAELGDGIGEKRLVPRSSRFGDPYDDVKVLWVSGLDPLVGADRKLHKIFSLHFGDRWVDGFELLDHKVRKCHLISFLLPVFGS